MNGGLVLYTRPGCSLCEQAQERLERFEFHYEAVDITGEAQWEERYGTEVPVLCLGEQVLLKGVFSRERLTQVKLWLLRQRTPEQGQPSTALGS